MATLETQMVDELIAGTRRRMLTMGGSALAGLAMAGLSAKADAQTTTTVNDNAILNFALNLEFLGAQYYSLAVYGVTADKIPSGSAQLPITTGSGNNSVAGGTVTTKPNFAAVPFISSQIKNYATQLLADEIGHVVALQSLLGTTSVAMPNIDLYNSFNSLAQLAGIAGFDPFANDAFFLLGAYLFEDTDTSAYHGAAPLITSKQVLPAAVAIHAVEAQHAGLIRSTIAAIDAAAGTNLGSLATVAISAWRAQVSGVGDVGVASQAVALEGSAGQYTASTFVDADANSLCWARTTSEILAIVTANNAGGATATANYTGGFYPNGLNGTIV